MMECRAPTAQIDVPLTGAPFGFARHGDARGKRRIRRIRPGSIETPDQADTVTDYAPRLKHGDGG